MICLYQDRTTYIKLKILFVVNLKCVLFHKSAIKLKDKAVSRLRIHQNSCSTALFPFHRENGLPAASLSCLLTTTRGKRVTFCA